MNVGILVDNLGISDKGIRIIDCLNKLNDSNINPVVFVKTYKVYPISPCFTIFNQSESYSFNGMLISTDFETTKIALNNFDAIKKFYYLWDLDWMFSSHPSYNISAEVFLNPKISFICRSTDHAKLLNRVWNRKANIIEEFDNEQFRKFLTDVKNK